MTNLDFDENDSDSDKYDNDNEKHEENKTARDGARFVKEKHGSTVDHETFQATPLDADLLPLPDEQVENDEAEASRPGDAIVKRRNKERLAAALARRAGSPCRTPASVMANR
jgi:hypothetical protein